MPGSEPCCGDGFAHLALGEVERGFMGFGAALTVQEQSRAVAWRSSRVSMSRAAPVRQAATAPVMVRSLEPQSDLVGKPDDNRYTLLISFARTPNSARLVTLVKGSATAGGYVDAPIHELEGLRGDHGLEDYRRLDPTQGTGSRGLWSRGLGRSPAR
jgi:hypothetical protein